MPTNPIKLCLATPSYFPIYSGPALRFKNYLPGFKKRGVIAEVFSGTPSQAELTTSGYEVFWKGYKTGEVMPASMVDDVPVHCVCLPEGHPWKRASTYNRTLARYSQYGDFHPDLIQFLSLPLAAIPALVKLRRLGIPTIFTHTLLADLSPNPYKRVLQRFLWRFPFQFVDLIIVSSSVMQARLQHDLRLKTPIEVIPNGVCLSRFRPANTSDER
jgi:glycosyltransferase involved in cell wall biosynthesis